MKVLLTGANGYIGKRLLPHLLDAGYEVICAVRDTNRFLVPVEYQAYVSVVELDLLKPETLNNIPNDIHGAFYLIHSMSSSSNYEELEEEAAYNFRKRANEIGLEHVVYLSGIANGPELSKHLGSRKNVENILHTGSYHCTTLRAGIIIGSGSASFEIIRDIVEKLPFMITPKWLKTKCQPIAIRDVLKFLLGTLFNSKTYDQNFDIGGEQVLTYKQMLKIFGEIRGLKRYILTLPLMTPWFSSYWLYFVTSTSFRLAQALVGSMKTEVVCRNDILRKMLDIQTISYKEAITRAFVKIESHEVLSSWKDSYISSGVKTDLKLRSTVPAFGCFKDKREVKVTNRKKVLDKVWSIGGVNGWYYGNYLWRLRGYLDKLAGGIGLRRGRTSPDSISIGDALDFWRVMYTDKNTGRLILYAEMKLPGEAWLEFKVTDDKLEQIATFRPKGVWGRLYWWSVFPFHGYIFKGMVRNIAS